jgi:hypothetical protein
MAISDKLRASCTRAELAEIEAWVKRNQAVNKLKLRHAAVTLPEQLGAAIEWFETADASEAREISDDILSAMRVLRSVLQRREFI